MVTVAMNLGESGLLTSVMLSATPSMPPYLLKGMKVPGWGEG